MATKKNENENENDNICYLCSHDLSVVRPDDGLYALPCGHVFHARCLARGWVYWFEDGRTYERRHTTCPRSTCGRNIPDEIVLDLLRYCDLD